MYRTANLLSIQKQNTHEENIKYATRVQMLQALVGGKLSVPLPIRIKQNPPTNGTGKATVKMGLAAREKLITGNMRLVLHWMNKAKRIPKTEDYLQYGVIGLCNAAERFDPTRGYRFSTFAYWQVKSAFLLGLYGTTSIIKIPAGTLLNLKKRLAEGKPLTPALLAAKDLLERPTTFLDFSVPEIENYFLPGDTDKVNPDWDLFLDNLDDDERAFAEDIAIMDETIEVAKGKRKWVNVDAITELSKDVLVEPTKHKTRRKPIMDEVKEKSQPTPIDHYLPSDLVDYLYNSADKEFQSTFVNMGGQTVTNHVVYPSSMTWLEYKKAWAREIGVDYATSQWLWAGYQQHHINENKVCELKNDQRD